MKTESTRTVGDGPKLAIFGTIETVPGRREKILPLLMEHKARCLRDEPGTIQFEVLVPRDPETKLLVYEVYQDDAAFDTHLNGPSIAQWRNDG